MGARTNLLSRWRPGRRLGAAAAALAIVAVAPAVAAEEGRPVAEGGLQHRKAGPWSATLKVGPAIEASTQASTQVALEVDLAYALVGERGYLGIAPQLQIVDDAMIVLPVAFQYDVRLPIADLAVYPRLEAGFATVPAADVHGFAFQPTVGVKWQLHDRVHAVLEPLSFPMTFGDPVLVHARIFAGAGADF